MVFVLFVILYSDSYSLSFLANLCVVFVITCDTRINSVLSFKQSFLSQFDPFLLIVDLPAHEIHALITIFRLRVATSQDQLLNTGTRFGPYYKVEEMAN